jgi:hypothetical protein
MRETPIPLFVVFSFVMQFPMLTGLSVLIFRGMGRVHGKFTDSVSRPQGKSSGIVHLPAIGFNRAYCVQAQLIAISGLLV